jgi:Flp pilus assembly protein TadB
MTVFEPALIAFMIFSGSYLLARCCVHANLSSLPPKAALAYGRKHENWTRSLVATGIVSFPGIAFVRPAKCWLCAEAIALSTLSAGTFLASGPGKLLLVPFASCVLGFCALYFSLRSECAGAMGTFREDLPLAAFMMSLLMESGLGPASAMKETIAALPPRGCALELGEIMKGREMGKAKSELFDASRKRVPIDDYRSFLNLVEQGDRLGVGLSQGLKQLSDRILESQSHRSEMLAQQAAVKMLLPLVLFIFPAVFLIVLSPVILNLCGMAGLK